MSNLTVENIESANSKVPYCTTDIFSRQHTDILKGNSNVLIQLSNKGAHNTKVFVNDIERIELTHVNRAEVHVNADGATELHLVILNPRLTVID